MTVQVNPFEMTTIEFEKWYQSEQQRKKDIHALLIHLQFIPSLWKKQQFILHYNKICKVSEFITVNILL